jgi:hypothetical protein
MYTVESRERHREALKTLEVRLARRTVLTPAWDLYASMEKSPEITAATRPACNDYASSLDATMCECILTIIPVALYDSLIESSNTFQAWADRISFNKKFSESSTPFVVPIFEISSATQSRARTSDGWPR